MANKFKTLVCIAAVLQLIRMYDAAIPGSNVIYTTNSINQATGGVAVDHPAQATIYAKRGKLNVLIPFEFTIIPLTQNSIEPEIPSRTSTPVSGSISSQPNSNYYRTNPNSYRPVVSYQTSSYPWYNNNNYNNRGFYVPASPSVSPSYQPLIQPNQQNQNGYQPIIYQQQLPPNTYRSQYYAPNSNVAYAPSYQRPWPQYNRPNKLNQSQKQPNWSATNTKPINISEMNSTHPPNATIIPTLSNNQTTSVTTNSTAPTNTVTGTVPKTTTTTTTTTVETTKTETIPTTKDQPAVPTDAAKGPPNPNNSNDDTQKEKAKPIDGEQVSANQHGETILDKNGSLPEVKSIKPQNSGEMGSGGTVYKPESSHTDAAPTPIDNNIKKAENTNQEQASVVNMN